MKLKVGDIELDSSSPPQARHRVALSPAPPGPSPGVLGRKRRFGVLLSAAALLGGAQVLLGRLPAWGVLLSLGALVVVHLVMSAVEQAKPSGEQSAALEPTAEPEALIKERAARVLLAIRASGATGASFAELERALGWVEPVLAQTLVTMLADDQIEEALDVETGRWSYKISQEVRFGWDEPEDDACVSLAQRLERLEMNTSPSPVSRSER